MKFRALVCLLVVLAPVCLLAKEESPTSTPKPDLWHRLLLKVGLTKPKSQGTMTTFRQLEMGLLVDPSPVKLADSHQIKVTLTLINRASKMVQLDFPTSQRVEVLLKTKDGKTIEQWSQDQAFTNEPTLVTINPNERLEYSVNVATRDMAAGETYTVEGFFPNFDPLRKTVPITAQK